MTRRGSFTAGLLVAAAVATLAAFTGLGAATTNATAPANSSPPTIGGSATEGSTLTASSGSWSGDTPISFSYQWSRCDSSGSSCSNISGATNQTLQLGSDDVGKTIRVFVTATNGAGAAAALSSATSEVAKSSSGGSGKPNATSQPNISGTAQVGQTLTSETGSWSGRSPIAFAFAWERCDSKGASCATIKDATKQTYVVATSDVGARLRTIVTATNADGSGTITSNLTGTVAASASDRPGVVTLPTLSGAAQAGATLTTTAGSWRSSTTVHFTYAWLRCDTNGNNCAAIAGAAGTTYKATSSDQGHTLRAQVTATNSAGAAASTSAQTAVVAAATATPTGKTVLVTSVNPPDRLVIAGVKFTPKRITTRSPFTARFRVTDTKGDPVQGALVYAVTLPYGTVAKAPEMPTDASGYATIVLRPTSRLELRHGSIVIFVRARKAGDPLLTGISTRRLVQVLVR